MASLKMPAACKCGSTALKRLFKPERWVCLVCDDICVSRSLPPDKTQCRRCKAPRDSKPFKGGKNLCLECFNITCKEWRNKNPIKWREWRNRTKAKRQQAVRDSVQRSPQSFLTYLFGSIKKRTNSETGPELVAKGKLNPVCLNPTIVLEDLFDLWESQAGKCALSGLPMVYEFGCLCAVSIDRKDSKVGYIPGNIQLVCQWVNKAKGNRPDAEFLAVLGDLYVFMIADKITSAAKACSRYMQDSVDYVVENGLRADAVNELVGISPFESRIKETLGDR